MVIQHYESFNWYLWHSSFDHKINYWYPCLKLTFYFSHFLVCTRKHTGEYSYSSKLYGEVSLEKKILHYLDWVQELEHTVPQPCKATAEELKKKYTSYRSYTAVLLKLIIYFESSSKNKKRHLTNTFTTNKYIDASGIHVCIFHKQTYGNWITEAEAG